ncbi:MAG: M23 family metallopeptidase [Brevinematales bacterium]|nr:M23 family metallopeptidase [Brevinematales bacterium]
MNRFSDRIKENLNALLYDFRRWLKIKNSEIQKWGHEKLTIMFVPHSEKRVITIHISNFALLFVSIILSIIVVTSIIAVSNRKMTDQKVIRLEKQNEIKDQYINNFINNANLLKDRFASFRSDVNKIFSLTTLQNVNSEIKYPEKQEEDKTPISSVDDVIYNKPKEIDELYKLRKEIEIYKIQIQKFAKFVENSQNVIKYIPSVWPIKDGSGHITSKFGYRRDPFMNVAKFHSGIDIAHWPGTPVIATADGVVSSAGWSGGYGKVVKISHKYGFVSVYGHLMSIYVSEGQFVRKGQIIGSVGMSGRATGYHLHYEVRIGTELVDPMPYLSIRLFE